MAGLYEGHKFDYRTVTFGLQRMLWGAFKKLVISARLGIIVDTIYGNTERYNGLYIWLAAALFMLQLYTDFSGCMDIVIGASECYGVTLPENFRTPFFSCSVQEFWQRWHITLGGWMRDYILYSVLRSNAWQKLTKWVKAHWGKKAAKQLPSYLAMLCVWLLMGLWHGGSWKFVLGVGLWFWAMITLSQVFDPVFKKLISLLKINTECFSWHLFQSLRMFVLVSIGVMFFRLDGLVTTLRVMKDGMHWNPWIFVDGSLYKLGLDRQNVWAAMWGLVILLVVSILQEKGKGIRERLEEQNLAFCVAFLLLLNMSQFVLQDKTSNTFAGVRLFFSQDPAPDVVFLGNSQVSAYINPLLIYHEQGITGYSLGAPGCGGEPIPTYVKTIIKTCSPKVIVIEAFVFLKLMNIEARSHQWMDNIPNSVDKIRTVNRILDNNARFNPDVPFGSLISYLFPLLRYHGRWEELTSRDFTLVDRYRYYHGIDHYYGYVPNFRSAEVDLSHYYDDVSYNDDVLDEEHALFRETVQLCKAKTTELVIVKTPCPSWTLQDHEYITTWAEEFGVKFIDYNETLETLEIDTLSDFHDDQHMSDTGASKQSHALGEFLRENYDLPDHRGDQNYAQWDENWQVYLQDKASYFLSQEKDWTAYLEKLQNPNYTIYMAARETLGANVFPELTEQLKTIGLTPELDTAARTGYLAVIDGGKVIYERLEDVPLNYVANINGHHVEMVSESGNQGNRASIQFDWEERSLDRRGINILVYDNLLKDVVDCVTFDLWDGGKAYR